MPPGPETVFAATYLLDAALGTLGVVTGMISGVTVRGPGGARPATRTTPEAAVLQRILAEFREQDVGAVPMEVSSHAIVQGLVDGVWFRTVAFTNLGPDHLDFHGTMDRYFAAKAALFTPDRAKAAVVNRDDEYARRLAATARIPVWTHSTNDTHADLYADEIRCGADGTDFSLHTPDGYARVRLSLLGPHQVGNALTALTSLAATGADVLGAAAGLETLHGVPGPPRRRPGFPRPRGLHAQHVGPERVVAVSALADGRRAVHPRDRRDRRPGSEQTVPARAHCRRVRRRRRHLIR